MSGSCDVRLYFKCDWLQVKWKCKGVMREEVDFRDPSEFILMPGYCVAKKNPMINDESPYCRCLHCSPPLNKIIVRMNKYARGENPEWMAQKDSRRMESQRNSPIANGWQRDCRRTNSMIYPFDILLLSVCHPFAILGKKVLRNAVLISSNLCDL